MRITNSSFKENIFTSIVELGVTDLNIVTRDGIHSTQRLLLWAAFPSLHHCFLESFESSEEVTVILPEESVEDVQKGIVKMMIEGDLLKSLL